MSQTELRLNAQVEVRITKRMFSVLCLRENDFHCRNYSSNSRVCQSHGLNRYQFLGKQWVTRDEIANLFTFGFVCRLADTQMYDVGVGVMSVMCCNLIACANVTTQIFEIFSYFGEEGGKENHQSNESIE